MKSIWKGTLSFGLINIPVQVYPASEEHALEFHMLHKKDLSPIRFARVCQAEDKEVPFRDIVKGYEYEKGEFVVVDEDDFKAANAKKTSTIDIQHFARIAEINPIYFEKPYLLEPAEKGGKAYELLKYALMKSGKVAIATFVFRHREHLGTILPTEEGLFLIQMRYQTEMRDFSEMKFPKEKLSTKELEMALSLIEQETIAFQPEKYHDTYVEELMSHIEAKLKGKKKRVPLPKVPTHAAKDLMGLLQKSLHTKPSKRLSR